MTRKPKRLATAGGLALAGTLLLAGYVRTADASASDDLVEVLVATDTIDAGTPASEIADLVSTEEVSEDVAAAGAVTDLDDLDDLVAANDVSAGDQLVASSFVPASELRAVAVPDGLLEVTVALDPMRALGGKIAPGDLVAVVASFDDDGAGSGQPVTRMIEQGATVVRIQTTEPLPAVDGDGGAIELAPAGSLLVTLALDADSVERVVFAAEHGRLWLAEMGDDTVVDGTAIQTKASVLR